MSSKINSKISNVPHSSKHNYVLTGNIISNRQNAAVKSIIKKEYWQNAVTISIIVL